MEASFGFMAKLSLGSEASTTLRVLGNRIRPIPFILLAAASTTGRRALFGFAGNTMVNGGHRFFRGVLPSHRLALASGFHTTSEAPGHPNHPPNPSRLQTCNDQRE